MKPKFENLYIEMTLRISPVMNPKLDIPDELTTRRGLVCPPQPVPTTFEELEESMRYELRGGLRALKNALQKDGYVKDDRYLRNVIKDGGYYRVED